MAKRITIARKVFFVFLLLCVSARLFTGAANVQVNFLGLLEIDNQSKSLVQEVPQDSLGVFGSVLADHRDASSIPSRHSDYKLYKKYIMTDTTFRVEENFAYEIQQFIVSLQSTSYYIKDLTLKSLHSNSPPVPATTFLFIVLMYLFINRIGVFGNHGENKDISDRGFCLQ